MKERNRKLLFRRGWLLFLVVCVLAVGTYVLLEKTGKAPFQTAKREAKTLPPAVPVVAVKARKTDFHVYITGLGSVTPVHTVTVRTRVDGQLMEVLYREGQIVQAGSCSPKSTRGLSRCNCSRPKGRWPATGPSPASWTI